MSSEHNTAAKEHQEPPPSNQPYRPALDGMRALAILPVLIFHLQEKWFPGGFVGVDVFFVLSGYLITSGLLREAEHGSIRLGRFYQRRIARLFPSMVLVLAVSAVAGFLLYDRSVLGLVAPTLIASVLSVSNLLSAHESNYFSVAKDWHPFLHFWSLSVEEQFYLFFPLLLVVVHRARRAWLRPTLLVLWAGSLSACVWFTRLNQTEAFYLLPTRAWELLTGAILAQHFLQSHKSLRVSAPVLTWAGLLVLLASYWCVQSAGFPGIVATLPVFGTAVLMTGLHGRETPISRVLSTRPLVKVGQLSYVLYLWHLPIFCLVDYSLFLSTEAVRTSLKLTLTCVAAVATSYFVENPARWWMNRPTHRAFTFGFAAVAALTFVTAGVWMRLRGWPEPPKALVAHGGYLLNLGGDHGTIALAGDSQACASAATVHDIAVQQHMQLHVLCMSASDPLAGGSDAEWQRTLAGVQHVRPDVLVLEMAWPYRTDLPQMLAASVAALQPFTQRIVLVTQYPVLVPGMPREAMRDGLRGPVFERVTNGMPRQFTNGIVRTFAQQHGIPVVETEPGFEDPGHAVRVLNDHGQPLYFDWMHASSLGTATYRDRLAAAIAGR